MDVENSISKIIAAADTQESQFDAYCKVVLAHKEILAWILKSSIKEFENSSITDIAHKYIEGEPLVGSEAVNRNETGEYIDGMNTEDMTLHEGVISYDLKFSAIAPINDKMMRIIINVEAQSAYNPGYPLIKRGIYYCGRMISAQYGTEFVNAHYEKLKKVYSVWICLNPPKKDINTITRYSFKEENLIGNKHEDVLNYDLMAVTMICLGDDELKEADGVLKMLEVLFSTRIEQKEKRNILNDEFDIAMTEELEREVSDMCNLSQGIKDRAMSEGIEKGSELTNISNIKNLMKNMNWSIEQAMSAIGLSEKDKIYYVSVIEKEC